MNNKMKLGITALMLVGSANALAADDLKSTGLAPEPITNDVAPADPVTGVPSASDMGMGTTSTSTAVSNASDAVMKAQEATEAARIANEAAKVANDVAKMATDKATEATDIAKKAMDANGVGGASGMGIDSGASMTGDTMKSSTTTTDMTKKKVP